MNVYFLLDRSGSMESLWTEAIGSINGYVKELPENTNIFLAAFDTVSFDVVRNMVPASQFTPIGPQDEISPRGSTPLFDASARVMQRILEDNPEKAIFVTMTDGFENASKKATQSEVKKLAGDLEKKGYEVIFLGANFDKVGDVAASYGLKSNKFVNMNRENMGSTMRGFAAMSTSYATTGGSIDITDEDKKKAVGEA